MDALVLEYLPILIFLAIAAVIAVVPIAASYIIVRQRPDAAKNSAYECGFDAFEDARRKFDVRFTLWPFFSSSSTWRWRSSSRGP